MAVGRPYTAPILSDYLGGILVLLLRGSVTLGKLFTFSVPQFSYLL